MKNEVSGPGSEAAVPLPWQGVQSRAESFWPRIAQDLDLPVAGVKFQRLAVNQFEDHRRCVLRVILDDQREFVLRAEFNEKRKEAELRIIDRMRLDAEALQSVPGVMVPQILWQDDASPVVLMEKCPGSSMYQELVYCELGFGQRAEIVERVAAALAKLHRARGSELRKFWPKPVLDTVSARAEQIRSGEKMIRKKPKFLGLSAYLHRAGRRARGGEFQDGLEHGDLHMKNVLVSETQVSFVDFNNVHSRMPYDDITKLWMLHCPEHLAAPGVQEGLGAVATADWDAFSRGYGVDLQDDPIFQFCLALRLWRQWQTLSPPGGELSAQNKAKLDGTIRAFDTLIANEPD